MVHYVYLQSPFLEIDATSKYEPSQFYIESSTTFSIDLRSFNRKRIRELADPMTTATGQNKLLDPAPKDT